MSPCTVIVREAGRVLGFETRRPSRDTRPELALAARRSSPNPREPPSHLPRTEERTMIDALLASAEVGEPSVAVGPPAVGHPSGVDDRESLDSYSRAVVAVVERVGPAV